ncbi:fatty acid synthase subunit beta, partial [Puccinia sorghi]
MRAQECIVNRCRSGDPQRFIEWRCTCHCDYLLLLLCDHGILKSRRSKQDVEGLVSPDFVIKGVSLIDKELDIDLNYILPFAAIPDNGRKI